MLHWTSLPCLCFIWWIVHWEDIISSNYRWPNLQPLATCLNILSIFNVISRPRVSSHSNFLLTWDLQHHLFSPYTFASFFCWSWKYLSCSFSLSPNAHLQSVLSCLCPSVGHLCFWKLAPIESVCVLEFVLLFYLFTSHPFHCPPSQSSPSPTILSSSPLPFSPLLGISPPWYIKYLWD